MFSLADLKDEEISRLVLLLTILMIVFSYYPLISPIFDSKLQFDFMDFTTYTGDESGSIRKENTLYAFSKGGFNTIDNRFLMLGGLGILSDYFSFSDAQFHSALMLISIILGVWGIRRCIRIFESDEITGYMLLVILSLFYFLNLWAVERIVHIWIWFGYAVFPAFLSFGLSFAEDRKKEHLVLYSVFFGIFGFMPHNFIYLLFIHGFLALSLVFRKMDIKEVSLFLILPLVIYFFMNFPLFQLANTLSIKYPFQVTSINLQALSNNGELAKLFTFTNNWWPQLGEEETFGNIMFRHSSILIFVIIFSLYVFSSRNFKRREQSLGLMAFLAILGLIFFAQGTNNEILSRIIGFMADAGKMQLLGPFREWARLSILIPVFLSLIVILGISKIRTEQKKVFLGALILMVLLNLASTPAWRYIHEKYAPAHLPEEFYSLDEVISEDYKSLLIAPISTAEDRGSRKFFWDKKDSPSKTPFGIASIYPEEFLIKRMLEAEESPGNLLNSLNIRYVIFKEYIYAEENFPFDYEWLDCRKTSYHTICENDDARGMFSAYEGTVATGSLLSDVYFLTSIEKDYAVSDDTGDHSKFILVKDEEDIGEGVKGRAISVFEAEKNFQKNNLGLTREYDSNASNRAVLAFQNETEIKGEFIIPKDGEYIIAVRGKGKFTLKLNNESFDFGDNVFSFSYSEPIQLGDGKENFTIIADKNSALDVIWAYEATENERIEDLFNVDDPAAVVKSFTRISPTSYYVTVDAERPFLLGFAETYSPYWEAMYYKDEEKIVSPVELYGLMNGFWIDDTGELEIRVNYKPQDSYEGSFIVTIISVGACAAYIIHGYMKPRGRSDGRKKKRK